MLSGGGGGGDRRSCCYNCCYSCSSSFWTLVLLLLLLDFGSWSTVVVVSHAWTTSSGVTIPPIIVPCFSSFTTAASGAVGGGVYKSNPSLLHGESPRRITATTTTRTRRQTTRMSASPNNINYSNHEDDEHDDDEDDDDDDDDKEDTTENRKVHQDQELLEQDQPRPNLASTKGASSTTPTTTEHVLEQLIVVLLSGADGSSAVSSSSSLSLSLLILHQSAEIFQNYLEKASSSSSSPSSSFSSPSSSSSAAVSASSISIPEKTAFSSLSSSCAKRLANLVILVATQFVQLGSSSNSKNNNNNNSSNVGGGGKRNLAGRQKLQQASLEILLLHHHHPHLGAKPTTTTTSVVHGETTKNNETTQENNNTAAASIVALALLLATLSVWETTTTTLPTPLSSFQSGRQQQQPLSSSSLQPILRSVASAIASTLQGKEARTLGHGGGSVGDSDEAQKSILQNLVFALVSLSGEESIPPPVVPNTKSSIHEHNNCGHKVEVDEEDDDDANNNSINNSSRNNDPWRIDLHIVTTLARATSVTHCRPDHTDALLVTTKILQKALAPWMGQAAAERMLRLEALPTPLEPPQQEQPRPGSDFVVSELIQRENASSSLLSLSQQQQQQQRLKSNLASALALAAQVQPWQICCPSSLVEAATALDLWHAAELICDSTIAYYKKKNYDNYSRSRSRRNSGSANTSTILLKQQQQQQPVYRLIDSAFAAKSYRKADTFATQFFDHGGQSRFLTARYLHACDTIGKVISKGALPVIEKVVQRIDQSVQRLAAATTAVTNAEEEMDETSIGVGVGDATTLVTASQDIRSFALQQLEERGNMEAAHRLARIWDMEYVFDATALAQAQQARRDTYLQYDALLPPGTSIPEVLSTPQDLRREWSSFIRLAPLPVVGVVVVEPTNDEPLLTGRTKEKQEDNETTRKPARRIFGFDTEFGDDDAPGAALLQIANLERVLLIDVPALCLTDEGREALRDTVGCLFQSSPEDCVVVGFACRQDVSKLRQTGTRIPSKRQKNDPQHKEEQQEARMKQQQSHWLGEVNAVVDLKSFLPDTLNQVGLSRTCEQYLGKSLDKSEQCSQWTHRPLTKQQRIYASLDAYVCALIYQRHFQ
jgi:hypothetical protein